VRHLAAALPVVAVTAVVLAVQPLRSPWWSGYDYDTVYGASALALLRGERSAFYDHPGVPLQETLAGALTVTSLVSAPDEDRAGRADAFLADLDRLRPYLRTLAAAFLVLSALIAFAAVAWVFRSAAAGAFAGLCLLAAPDVIAWAAVLKPDPLLAALSVATVALLVEGARRRSASLYVGAAATIGFAISVKVHALGLLAPLAAAVVFWPPRTVAPRDVIAEALAAVRRQRRVLTVIAAVGLVLAVLLNALAALPDARSLAELGVAVVLATGLALVLQRATRRTSARRYVDLAIMLGAAGLAGAIVPNLLYANMPGPMLRWLAVTLSGRGVETTVGSTVAPWDVLQPWGGLAALAAVGLVIALRAGDRTTLLWAFAAAAMGGLALLRYGSVHYYTPAIALLAPLALPALAALARWPLVLAVALFVVFFPAYRAGIDEARDRGQIARETERVNEWVEPRLQNGEVALTFLESNDSRYFNLVRFYDGTDREPVYRFLPATSDGVAYAASHNLHVRYVIAAAPSNPSSVVASLGLGGRGHRTGAPGFVYEVDG
jgi:hypothetical protein